MENKKTLNLIGLRLYYWALIINLIGSFGAALVTYGTIWDYLNVASMVFITVALFLLAKFNRRYLLARNLYIITTVLLISAQVLLYSSPEPTMFGEMSLSIYLALFFSIAALICSYSIVFIVMHATADLCQDCHQSKLSERIDTIRTKYGGALACTIAFGLFILLPYIGVFAMVGFIAAFVWMIVIDFQWLGRISEAYTTLHGTDMPDSMIRYMEK